MTDIHLRRWRFHNRLLVIDQVSIRLSSTGPLAVTFVTLIVPSKVLRCLSHSARILPKNLMYFRIDLMRVMVHQINFLEMIVHIVGILGHAY